MANISTLTVSLVAETAKFSNDLKKARNTSRGFGRAIAGGFKIAAAATAALTGAMALLTRQSLEVVDSQTKAARVLGTTQRVYAGLALAAELSGVQISAFEKALKRQQKSIVDANDGLQTQARAFQRLGLDTAELINLPVEEQFRQITQALGQVENQTLKVAAASDIFGAKNADLLNILELGEDGLQTYIDKVDELGVALTTGQTAAIENANDQVSIFKQSLAGLGNQLAAQFAPSIARAAQALTNFVSSITRNVERVAINVRAIFGLQQDLNVLSLEGLRQQYALTMDEVMGLKRQLDDLINGPRRGRRNIPALIERTRAEIERLEQTLVDNIDLQKEFLNPPEPPGFGDSDDPLAGLGDAQARKFQAQYDAAIRAVADASERLQLKLNEIRDGLENNPLIDEELAGRQAEQAVDAYLAEITRLRDEADAIVQAQQDQADQLARSVATPLEELQARMMEIRMWVEQNPLISEDTTRRLAQDAVDAYLEEMERLSKESEDIFENMGEFQRSAFQNMQGILAEFLFDPWEEGLDGMLKSFVDMLRRMIAQLLASKILEYFFGLFGGASVPTGGGSAGSILTDGGPRAVGGMVDPTRSYLVGERGPEVFSPGAKGSIRPMTMGNFESNLTIEGGGGLDIATLIPILEENNRKVKGEILDAFDRGAYA